VEYRREYFHSSPTAAPRASDKTGGRVKVLPMRVGPHLRRAIIGPRAGGLDCRAAWPLASPPSATIWPVVGHAHPTLAEALREAALAVETALLTFSDILFCGFSVRLAMYTCALSSY